jgi:K+-transporting ATPase A subunit
MSAEDEMARYVWIGFAVWLFATVAIRFGGGGILPTGPGLRFGILLAVTALVIGAAISLLVRRIPAREVRLEAAVLLVLPGILLDTGSVLWFPAVFPNLPAGAGLPFAALLLWAYGIALLAGLLAKPGAPEIVG